MLCVLPSFHSAEFYGINWIQRNSAISLQSSQCLSRKFCFSEVLSRGLSSCAGYIYCSRSTADLIKLCFYGFLPFPTCGFQRLQFTLSSLEQPHQGAIAMLRFWSTVCPHWQGRHCWTACVVQDKVSFPLHACSSAWTQICHRIYRGFLSLSLNGILQPFFGYFRVLVECGVEHCYSNIFS